jgi:hypothetical protein
MAKIRKHKYNKNATPRNNKYGVRKNGSIRSRHTDPVGTQNRIRQEVLKLDASPRRM